MSGKESRVIGLMSGTSLDGMDLALVSIKDHEFELCAFQDFPFEPDFQDRLRQFLLAPLHEAAAFIDWHVAVGIRMGQCIQEFAKACGPGPIHAVGIHGPTYFHQPSSNPGSNGTFQLGCAAQTHRQCGLPIIYDFRNGDMAWGGQGAPLVPFLEQFFFHNPNEDRLFVNLGGIANATFLPKGRENILAYDTGPANMVLDFLVQTEGKGQMDVDGKMARSGSIVPDLLQKWLSLAYFAEKPPKSTGRELFNQAYCRVAKAYPLTDQLATATELTAVSLSRSVLNTEQDFFQGRVFDPIYLSGGGAKNRFMIERLQHHLPNRRLLTTQALGLDPAAKEAVLMALLAHAHLHSIPANLPSVTGADQKVILGSRIG